MRQGAFPASVLDSWGILSSDPWGEHNSWVYFMVDMDDMPSLCPHHMRRWYCDSNRHRRTIAARHPPTTDASNYRLVPVSPTNRPATATNDRPIKKRFVSGQLSAYRDLLNIFLVAKIQPAVYKAPPFLLSVARPDKPGSPGDAPLTSATTDVAAQATLKRCRFSLSEQIISTETLRGIIPLTERDEADNLAIAGLRNTADRVGRLQMVSEFGKRLGAAIRTLLNDDTAIHVAQGTHNASWVNMTCDALGSDDPKRGPPPLQPWRRCATYYGNSLISQASTFERHASQFQQRAMLDAQLHEAWRAAAGDPDSHIYLWLRDGAPTGIRNHVVDPGIFPTCHRPADLEPQDLRRGEQQFRSYPGVEEQDITDAELTAHLAKGHLAAFDSHAVLQEFMDCPKPILNKLGLIVTTGNGITKARMILDTEQRSVKRITSQAQRVLLPRLFDAILQILFFLIRVTNGSDSSVSAFVLDFSDAFWQMPIALSEQQFFCATGLIGGKRKCIAFLRVPQGSAAAPTLWGRLAVLVMRLTQSFVEPTDARLVCYVDDPLAAISGTRTERRTLAAI